MADKITDKDEGSEVRDRETVKEAAAFSCNMDFHIARVHTAQRVARSGDPVVRDPERLMWQHRTVDILFQAKCQDWQTRSI